MFESLEGRQFMSATLLTDAVVQPATAATTGRTINAPGCWDAMASRAADPQ
jgi:hypothetical protein